MVKEDDRKWKEKYFSKLAALLEEYPKILIVGVDNVRSTQMQQIRLALRGRAELLMGKNTMIRKVVRGALAENPKLESLLKHVKGNVGFVFTKMDLAECRDLVLKNKVKAPAKAFSLAPCSVTIPAGNTGMGPEKTSFFQALNISTKIVKGTIEITNDIDLIKEGTIVGVSEAALLALLNILPFSYGLQLQQVYDNGAVYAPEVLDIKESDLLARFRSGVARVASVSLAIRYPTLASVPHSIANGFKNVLAVAVATEISFPKAEKAKAYLKDPSAFAVAAPVAKAAPAPAKGAAPAAAKAAEPPKKEEKSDAEMDGGMSLFD